VLLVVYINMYMGAYHVQVFGGLADNMRIYLVQGLQHVLHEGANTASGFGSREAVLLLFW
jgi:hypothetical protein